MSNILSSKDKISREFWQKCIDRTITTEELLEILKEDFRPSVMDVRFFTRTFVISYPELAKTILPDGVSLYDKLIVKEKFLLKMTPRRGWSKDALEYSGYPVSLERTKAPYTSIY